MGTGQSNNEPGHNKDNELDSLIPPRQCATQSTPSKKRKRSLDEVNGLSHQQSRRYSGFHTRLVHAEIKRTSSMPPLAGSGTVVGDIPDEESQAEDEDSLNANGQDNLESQSDHDAQSSLGDGADTDSGFDGEFGSGFYSHKVKLVYSSIVTIAVC